MFSDFWELLQKIIIAIIVITIVLFGIGQSDAGEAFIGFVTDFVSNVFSGLTGM